MLRCQVFLVLVLYFTHIWEVQLTTSKVKSWHEIKVTGLNVLKHCGAIKTDLSHKIFGVAKCNDLNLMSVPRIFFYLSDIYLLISYFSIFSHANVSDRQLQLTSTLLFQTKNLLNVYTSGSQKHLENDAGTHSGHHAHRNMRDCLCWTANRFVLLNNKSISYKNKTSSTCNTAGQTHCLQKTVSCFEI